MNKYRIKTIEHENDDNEFTTQQIANDAEQAFRQHIAAYCESFRHSIPDVDRYLVYETIIDTRLVFFDESGIRRCVKIMPADNDDCNTHTIEVLT